MRIVLHPPTGRQTSCGYMYPSTLQRYSMVFAHCRRNTDHDCRGRSSVRGLAGVRRRRRQTNHALQAEIRMRPGCSRDGSHAPRPPHHRRPIRTYRTYRRTCMHINCIHASRIGTCRGAASTHPHVSSSSQHATRHTPTSAVIIHEQALRTRRHIYANLMKRVAHVKRMRPGSRVAHC